MEQPVIARPPEPETRLPGFFGKLPARGDFVHQRLDHTFRTTFDEWLQRSIATSKRQLEESWLPAYLNAPIWRFVLGPGVCGDAPALGVMMPSVDRVGRYFPLVLAVQLPDCDTPGSMFRDARDWFEKAETLILTSLGDEFDLGRFDAAIKSLGVPPYRTVGSRGARPLRLGLAEDGEVSDTYARILDQVLMSGGVRFSLWWTLGSDRVQGSVLIGPGMPAPSNFAAFIDGHWDEWGWERPPGAAVTIEEFPLLLLKPLQKLPSAGRTHQGSKRRHNEDAMVLRADLGMWAVADGVGGHDAGQFASRTVAEHLDQVLPPLSFGGAVAEIRELLERANVVLRARAATISDDAIVASTVVVLLAYAGHCAVVWSGDSRCYRLRDGKLQLLTRDHAAGPKGMVTHAVGADRTLFTDVVQEELRAGDRFLLCSDGITKELRDPDLEQALAAGSPDSVVGSLIEDCLVAGARDNITAVVVFG